jgi:polysaccharide pyruvyl transferase CsaB
VKVIYVIGGGEFGGAEKHILDLLIEIKQHGVQGKVICFYEAEFSQALRERGIEVTVLDYGRFDARLAKGLRRVFREEKPDLIHTHGVKANFFARLAAKDLADVPLVTTVHSLLRFDYENYLSYRIVSWMERVTRRYNSHYIAVSRSIGDSLLAEHIPPEQLTIVHHGIDVERFRPGEEGDEEQLARKRALRAEWGVPEDAYVIGSVGRLVKIKGIDYAIRAMTQVVKAEPRAHLVIIGQGPEEARLRELTAELGLDKHVTFGGFRSDIPDCMRAFDCFISPSQSEGLGLNILEAMATRLPVVITSVGGIRDYAIEGVNARIVQTCSSEDLADKLIQVISDPKRAAQLAATAREFVVEHFSMQSMGSNTVNVYRRLLELTRRHQQAQRKPDVRRLIISGYYGYGNSGDEAVLHAVLESLRKESEQSGISIDPVVLSINPHATSQMHGVKAIHRYNIRQILKAIRESDGLISGGGSLLQDTTGRMTIPYYLSIIKLAQWLNKPTFIYSHGVGPIESRSFYPFIHHVYDRSKYVSVRDQESSELLQEMGVDPKRVDVVSDPVIGLDLEAREPRDTRSSDRLIAGVSVRFWRRNREDLLQLAEALRMLLDAEPRITLRFLPFQTQMPNDIEASRFVMEHVGEAYKHRMELVTDAVYPLDMLHEVSACDVLIGMRLHSLIYAAAYYIPMIGISYDPKIDQFLARLEMQPASTTDDMDPHRIANEALELLEHADDWRAARRGYIDDLKAKSKWPAQQISVYLRK